MILPMPVWARPWKASSLCCFRLSSPSIEAKRYLIPRKARVTLAVFEDGAGSRRHYCVLPYWGKDRIQPFFLPCDQSLHVHSRYCAMSLLSSGRRISAWCPSFVRDGMRSLSTMCCGLPTTAQLLSRPLWVSLPLFYLFYKKDFNSAKGWLAGKLSGHSCCEEVGEEYLRRCHHCTNDKGTP